MLKGALAMNLPKKRLGDAADWIVEKIASTKIGNKEPDYYLQDDEHTREYVKRAVMEFLSTFGSEIVKLNKKTVMEEGDKYAVIAKNLLLKISKEEWLKEEAATLKALLNEQEEKAKKQKGRVRTT